MPSEPDFPPVPDMPPGPECPAALGEVVTCECALVEGCWIEDAVPEAGCEFSCDAPSPCPSVTCMFYDSTGEYGCETELDVAALECVFDALAEGQAIRWETRLIGQHFNWYFRSVHEHLRLDATTYVRFRDSEVGFHGTPESQGSSFVAFELPESEWMACDSLAEDNERFDCLDTLASQAEPCADASLLMCP